MALLGADDRLSIIRFESSASRITPLLRVQDANIGRFNTAITQLSAGGGTSIGSGMDLAFQTLEGRRVKNAVTSIFLLSDGLDGSGLPAV
jgi:uncharacterized protein YegL